MVAELEAVKRDETGTRQMKRLRAEGRTPGVMYGEGKPAKPLTVDAKTFSRLLFDGERVLILKIDNEDKQVLIKDVQFDTFGEIVLHVDFNELRAGQKVELSVEVELKGTAKGQSDGGVVNLKIHELEIECSPLSIPESILVDVSQLGLNEDIHVKDLTPPEGVVFITDGDEVVVSCEPPREEDEEPATGEGAATEPEVIGEKKEEEGEGEEKKD